MKNLIKKKNVAILVALSVLVLLVACVNSSDTYANSSYSTFEAISGTPSVVSNTCMYYLEPNLKLVDIDVKENDLKVTVDYILTRTMTSSDEACQYYYVRNPYYVDYGRNSQVCISVIETKLSDSQLAEYNSLKTQGYTIKDYLKQKGLI